MYTFIHYFKFFFSSNLAQGNLIVNYIKTINCLQKFIDVFFKNNILIFINLKKIVFENNYYIQFKSKEKNPAIKHII